MDKDTHQKLLDVLKENDSKEIPFSETKQSLLEQGYSEADISNALYESPYDGKKNVVKPADPATEVFSKSPQLAEQVGNQILDDAKKRERAEAVASGVASKFVPGIHARSKYEFEAIDRLGLPFFSIFLGGLIVYVLVVVLELPAWINTVFFIIIAAWISWTFYIRYIKK